MSKKQQQIFLIFLVMFIGLLGFGIVIPTLPFIALRFKASPFVIGLLMASYSLFQFIASPILGRLSDRYGRKPILAISLLGTALGYFLIAVANNIYLIFLSRIIDGITGGNISVAQAYIADITQGKERTKAMGLIGAAFGLGFVFGPMIGGILGSYFLSLPYIFAGGLALINTLFIIIALPETEKKTIRDKVKDNLFNLKVMKEVFKPKIILKLTLIFFIVTLSFSLLQGMFSLYTKDLFGWNQKQLGYYFSLIGLTMIITQGVIIRKLVERLTEEFLMKSSLLIVTFCFLIYSFFKIETVFYLTAVIFALGFGIFNPIIQSQISKKSAPEEQGIVLGSVQGFGSLARGLGPILGGLLYSLNISFPFIASALLMFLGFLGL